MTTRNASDQESFRRFELEDQSFDNLLIEAPLLLKIDGQDLVTMRTPGHDKDLARGFLRSEGIIENLQDITSLTLNQTPKADTVEITLKASRHRKLKGQLSRVHEIRASCGLCGVPEVETLCQFLPNLKPDTPRLARKALTNLFTQMRAQQHLFDKTGGSHAAGLAINNTLKIVREDVGRHNAVDKVIGQALQQNLDFSQSTLLLSGRGGFELILKALRVGIPIIASVSAPSSMAFELAEEKGATLIGFVRGDRCRVYMDDGRLED